MTTQLIDRSSDISPQASQSTTWETRRTRPPRWLSRLTNLVAQAFQTDKELAPLGCHFHREFESEGIAWEVTLFVSRPNHANEFHAETADGSQFMLDLFEVLDAFSSVSGFYWQAKPIAEDDDLGPHVGIEGVFEGQTVWLRITDEPPALLEPEEVMDEEVHFV